MQAMRNVSGVLTHIALEAAHGSFVYGLVGLIHDPIELRLIVLSCAATAGGRGRAHVHQLRREERPAEAGMEQADASLPLLEQPDESHPPLDKLDGARDASSDEPASHVTTAVTEDHLGLAPTHSWQQRKGAGRGSRPRLLAALAGEAPVRAAAMAMPAHVRSSGQEPLHWPSEDGDNATYVTVRIFGCPPQRLVKAFGRDQARKRHPSLL